MAGSLDRLADKLAAIAPGRLALIAGDEIDASDASAQMVALADLLAAPVYGSSWPAHIPFPTAHPLWAGNLPTKATEIAGILGASARRDAPRVATAAGIDAADRTRLSAADHAGEGLGSCASSSPEPETISAAACSRRCAPTSW